MVSPFLPPNQGDKTPKAWSNPCSAKWRSIVEASGGIPPVLVHSLPLSLRYKMKNHRIRYHNLSK